MEAALKGSREIGFTIVSITLSLIAVFIPLFLMGGYVGKLFQEFAITDHRLAGALAAHLADADADDVRATAEARIAQEAWPAVSLVRKRLRRAAGALCARPQVALRHRFITLLVMLSTVARDRLSLCRSFRRASSRSRTPGRSSASPRPHRTSPFTRCRSASRR